MVATRGDRIMGIMFFLRRLLLIYFFLRVRARLRVCEWWWWRLLGIERLSFTHQFVNSPIPMNFICAARELKYSCPLSTYSACNGAVSDRRLLKISQYATNEGKINIRAHDIYIKNRIIKCCVRFFFVRIFKYNRNWAREQHRTEPSRACATTTAAAAQRRRQQKLIIKTSERKRIHMRASAYIHPPVRCAFCLRGSIWQCSGRTYTTHHWIHAAQ